MRYLNVVLAIMIILTITLFADESEGEAELTDSEQAWIDQGHIVRVRVGNWPPYQMNDGEKLTGVSVDCLKEIFDKYGINYELVSSNSIPWKAALEDIKNNIHIDLLLTAKITPDRKKDMLFTIEYIDPPWVIFTRFDSHGIFSIKDLNGKTVAVQDGFIIQRWLTDQYPGINQKIIKGVDTTSRAMEALAVGEADAYIGNLATGAYLIKSLNLHNLKIAAPTPFGNDKNSMAIRKDWPELVSIINKSLLLISQKRKNQFMSKYYNVRYEYGLGYWDIIIWVAVASILLCGIILFVLVSNKKLNKEISCRKLIQAEMKEYISLVDENIITISVDAMGMITSASNAFCRISKTKKENLLGQFFLETWSYNMPEEVHQSLISAVTDNMVWNGDVQKVTPDGSKYWVNITVTPKLDADGTLLGYVSVGQDITDKKRVEELSVTDRVTEIYNRLKLDELFTYELEQSRRYSHFFSIAIVDVDNFKDVNDTYGHPVGDSVLKIIASIFKNNTRASDTVGRWGGDEFLLICPATSLEDVICFAEKIRKIIETTQFPIIKNKSVSIGVACYQDGDTQESMLDRADKGLYKAKELGKNKVCL